MKKVLAVLILFVMAFSLVPAQAYAMNTAKPRHDYGQNRLLRAGLASPLAGDRAIPQ